MGTGEVLSLAHRGTGGKGYHTIGESGAYATVRMFPPLTRDGALGPASRESANVGERYGR